MSLYVHLVQCYVHDYHVWGSSSLLLQLVVVTDMVSLGPIFDDFTNLPWSTPPLECFLGSSTTAIQQIGRHGISFVKLWKKLVIFSLLLSSIASSKLATSVSLKH